MSSDDAIILAVILGPFVLAAVAMCFEFSWSPGLNIKPERPQHWRPKAPPPGLLVGLPPPACEDAPAIRFVGDLERLQIGPDDRFALTCDQPLSREVRDRIQAAWASFAGEGVKLLILEKGMKLGAINVTVERAA